MNMLIYNVGIARCQIEDNVNGNTVQFIFRFCQGATCSDLYEHGLGASKFSAIYCYFADIRVEDDGEYTCQVLDASGPVAGVTHFLTVPGTYNNNTRVYMKTSTSYRFLYQFVIYVL